MLLLACFFIGIGVVTAQTQKVTGVVISDEDGQPVIGASVFVKDTQMGVITDVDGKFELPRVPSSAKTLVVSFIGMETQELPIKPNMHVVMRSNRDPGRGDGRGLRYGEEVGVHGVGECGEL